MIRTGILHNPGLDSGTGDALRAFLHAENRNSARGKFVFTHESYVANDRNWLEDVLCRWCDEEELDLILTVGGTMPAPGPSRQELVPEATQAILDRALPGLPEAMRAHAGEFSELALMDRGVAGIRSRTLIINLPGGEGPAVCYLEAIAHLIGPIVAHLTGLPDAPQLSDEIVFVAENPVDPVQPDDQEPGNQETEQAQSGKLDADEFAEFLKRRKSSS